MTTGPLRNTGRVLRPKRRAALAGAAVACAAVSLFRARGLLFTAADMDVLCGPGATVRASASSFGHALFGASAALARAAAWLPLDPAIALRAPDIAAYWAMLLTIYLAVARSSSRLAGTWSVLFCASASYPSMYDTHAYGMIGGLTGAALLCWSRGMRGSHRAWLGGAAACVACATALHPSGAIAALALALAALVQARTSRMGAAPLIATAVPFVAALFVIAPLLSPAAGGARDFTWPVRVAKQLAYAAAHAQTTYVTLLGCASMTLVPLLATTIAIDSSGHDDWAREGPLIAPAAALALAPLWAVAPAWLATGRRPDAGALLPVVVGCAVLAGCAAARIAQRHGRMRAVGTVVLAASLAVAAARADALPTPKTELTGTRGRFALLAWENRLAPDLPVVVPDLGLYRELTFYAPRELAARLVHVEDDELPPTTRRGPAGDCPVPRVAALAAFTREHVEFYVFEASETRSPFLARIAGRGVHLSLIEAWAAPTDLTASPAYLYRVRLTGR